MKMDFAEKMRLFYEMCYQLEYGADIIAVINNAEPGSYESNPIIDEYAQTGYKLIDANMFGNEKERGEIFIFKPL